MWFVYILRCADNSLYVEQTKDLAARVAKHNDGSAAVCTASRRPVELVYAEQYETRSDCLTRERQLKGWTRSKKEALIAGEIALLRKL